MGMKTVYARGLALEDLRCLPREAIIHQAAFILPKTQQPPSDLPESEWAQRQLLRWIPADQLPTTLNVATDSHAKSPYLSSVVLSLPDEYLDKTPIEWIPPDAKRAFDAVEAALRESMLTEFLVVDAGNGEHGPAMSVESDVFDLKLRYQEGQLVIDDLQVADGCRRQGVGTRVVRAVMRACERLRLPLRVLPVRPRAFWEKLGFVFCIDCLEYHGRQGPIGHRPATMSGEARAALRN